MESGIKSITFINIITILIVVFIINNIIIIKTIA